MREGPDADGADSPYEASQGVGIVLDDLEERVKAIEATEDRPRRVSSFRPAATDHRADRRLSGAARKYAVPA
jgi:hypothetical protein